MSFWILVIVLNYSIKLVWQKNISGLRNNLFLKKPQKITLFLRFLFLKLRPTLWNHKIQIQYKSTVLFEIWFRWTKLRNSLNVCVTYPGSVGHLPYHLRFLTEFLLVQGNLYNQLTQNFKVDQLTQNLLVDIMTQKAFAVKNYTEEDLYLAITEAIIGKSLRKAVKDHNIPFGTFHRYYNSGETS